MPIRSAAARAPPWSKMGVSWRQWGQTKVDMFSTMPSTGMPTLSNMSLARMTSASAMSCGVDTSTTPAAFTFCARVSGTSPVPGGQVEQQVVELAPVHVPHELEERPGDHGAAPDHGLVGVDEEADGHELEAVGLDGVEPVAARPCSGAR